MTIWSDSLEFRGLMCYPLFWEEHILVYWLSILVASLKGIMPPLYRQWGSLFRWVGTFHIQEAYYLVLLSDMGLLTHFTPPFCLALPTMTQFHDWSHFSWGSLSAIINGYRCHSLCLMYMFLLRSAAKSCYLWYSPVLSGCSSRCPWQKLQLPVFPPREALLVGHWVITLPLSSCGILFFSPPTEVVLHGVWLVHLSHVWWLPIHKGMPISDAVRRSQFQWRTYDHPCWFITL